MAVNLMNFNFANKMIVCPNCGRGNLPSTPGEAEDVPTVSCLVCSACYPRRNGVLCLIPTWEQRRNLVQYLMELEAVVRIYEGPWWRQNPLFTALTRLSFAQEYQLIMEAAELEQHHVLLDLACGSGIYARPLAHQLSRGGVVGLDLSLPMLTYGSHLAQQEGLHNLSWIQGMASALPFADSCFDRVNCCGALHLFPELPQVLAEIKRVLQPQGIFTMAVFRQGNSSFSLWFSDVRHRLVGVQSFTAASLAQLLHQAGFTIVKCHHEQGIWLMMSAS